MGAFASKSIADLGRFFYDLSCKKTSVSLAELVSILKDNGIVRSVNDLKEAGISTKVDASNLNKTVLAKLKIQDNAKQASILKAVEKATQADTCTQIEKTINQARRNVEEGMIERSKVYEDTGAIGLANLTKRDVTAGAQDTISVVKKTSKNLSRAVGTKKTWFSAASILLIIVYVVIIYTWNPLGLSTHFPVTCIIILLFILSVICYGYNWISNTLDCGTDSKKQSGCKFAHEVMPGATVYKYLGKASSVVLIAIGMFMLLILVASIVESIGLGTSHFRRVLLFFIVLGVFSALYSSSSKLKKLVLQPINPPTLGKLLARLIFYIPCFATEMVDGLKKQFAIESSTTWIILFIELVLISMYFLVPLLLRFIISFNTNKILSDPIYLDHEEVHGDVEVLYNAVKRDGDYVFDKADRYVYTLSAWFRINPTPENYGTQFMDDACILSFGDRPRITYNNSTRMFKVRCKLSDKKTVSIYETDEMPTQYWNNVTITYNGASMTTFLNGELVGSSIKIAPLLEYDLIVSGQPNGLEGAIRDINFNRRVLTAAEIRLTYKSQALLSSGSV